MAVKLNKKGYTPQQLEEVEKLKRAKEKVERDISQEELKSPETYEKAMIHKNKIIKLKKKSKDISDKIEKVLNAREEFEKEFEHTEKHISHLEQEAKKYGFKYKKRRV